MSRHQHVTDSLVIDSMVNARNVQMNMEHLAKPDNKDLKIRFSVSVLYFTLKIIFKNKINDKLLLPDKINSL